MNIIVLCGGISTEREVSVHTGENVCEALRQKGHNAVLLDVYFGTDNINIFEDCIKKYDIKKAVEDIKANDGLVEKCIKEGKAFFGKNVLNLCAKADIVFMAVHGEAGENGKVQATFDLLNIKYTGTGCLGSAISMDKAISKQIFITNNIPTPGSVTLIKGKNDDYKNMNLVLPCVVKPSCGGSSVGVAIAHNEEELDAAVADAFSYENEILVEDYIEGREFSVGVIDGKALPIIEIIPKEGFYDYKNKYIPGKTDDICPANLDEELTKKMQEIAENAYKALRIESYGRIDVLMKNDGSMYCLEANTLPGMTATSLLPQEAAAIGIDFASLCELLIEKSMEKYSQAF